MRPIHLPDSSASDHGVATMVEYVMISGILMALFVVMLFLVNANFMDNPANTLAYSAFTDIGNGVSTRVVDVYAIAPGNGTISSRFDIPDNIAGLDYSVEISNFAGDDPTTQNVKVSRGSLVTHVAIAGIGSTKRAGGNTTGAGLNVISYDSRGF